MTNITGRTKPIRLLVLLLTSLFLCAPLAAETRAPSLDDLSWLEGSWSRKTARGHVMRESWKRISETTMEGTTEALDPDGGSPKTVESMRMLSMLGELFFVPRPAGNPLPVAFRLETADDRGMTFVNPDHDFPKTIRYEKGDDGSLRVTIEGPEDGEPRRIRFDFVRNP